MTWSGELIAFLTLCLAVAGSYGKAQSDITRLKTEVKNLQRNEREVATVLKDLHAVVHRVEKALVKAGFIEIE